MEYISLLGVLVIILGFAFKLDTIAVVVLSALVTALVSGIDFVSFLEILGKGFMDNRMVSLFFLTLPTIGIIERHGLKQAAVNLIHKVKELTPGRIFDIYLAIRELAGVFGISLQGHVQFIAPFINPMAQAAGKVDSVFDNNSSDLIKGQAAANENFGNFFAQNLFVASSSVLLIASTMKSLGHPVSTNGIVLYSIPMAVITFLICVYYNHRFDKQLEKGGSRNEHNN
ncbi:DUF969 domain-containing protein [Ligilactobacillus acidipiscis]|uniref:DUF969 domain-containing protein n=1 Tax=Ligilactobacillus acidipiscis TaxID=89059 RepID=UPI0023F8B2F0|nr:DUF969 domain-containing protein [Ligilactobacillus acidipiscis]WEV56477.1 DUF969 domain-containing protein [Ligilactobacillus acidipiscis]